jgi:hypothetical protein
MLADLPNLPLYVFPDLVSGHGFIIEVIRIVNIIIFPILRCPVPYKKPPFSVAKSGLSDLVFADSRY